jgi:type IV pilus assembly protein PilV
MLQTVLNDWNELMNKSFKNNKKVNTLNTRSEIGFTLIEILVSILILSIGILSFALLQAESLRATHTSMQRTKAIHFATDILERMRANRVAINSYAVTNVVPIGVKPADCSDAVSSGTSIDCDPDTVAAFDVWEWRSDIQDENTGIVGGTGEITVTGADPARASITISWIDRNVTNNISSYTLDTVILE